MTIICLEGASGIGKSTTCQAIAKQYNAYVVPEVNFLFERPNPEPENWYLERQVERWKIAQEKLKTYDFVLFDGDIFQPLWYNWIYEDEYPNSLPLLKESYRKQIKEKQIGFPDMYVHLSIDEHELRSRKENDRTRRRSNFEKHLRLVEPQERYFQVMNSFSPNKVCFVDAISVEGNVDRIFDALSCLHNKKSRGHSIWLFESLMDWLMKTIQNT